MYPVIEQIANDTGISIEEASYAFTIITDQILSKVPQLELIIEDVFINIDKDEFRKHLNKLVLLLQRQRMDVFKTWNMPNGQEIIPHYGNEHIL